MDNLNQTALHDPVKHIIAQLQEYYDTVVVIGVPLQEDPVKQEEAFYQPPETHMYGDPEVLPIVIEGALMQAHHHRLHDK